MSNKEITSSAIERMLESQLETWPTARDNYRALDGVMTKQLPCGLRVQFNPARMVSTGAKVDSATLAQRPCFLCSANRPVQQQSISWIGYEVLVNPFPIFPRHFTIPLRSHEPQSLHGRVADMAQLAKSLSGYTVFYNGARCGASAPDHMHFQAGNSDFLPIWDSVGELESDTLTAKAAFGMMGVLAYSSTDIYALQSAVDTVMSMLPWQDAEPMVNVLMRSRGEIVDCVVIPRRRHRPTFYGFGEGQMVVSPASVDLAGVMITPRLEDFERMDCDKVRQIIDELCYTPTEVQEIVKRYNEKMSQTVVSVGIMSAKNLEFVLHGRYLLDGAVISGAVSLGVAHVKQPLEFVPIDDDAYVEVKDVTIGINFHWERKEVQCFRGSIRIVRDGDELVFINILDIEEYLTSVISSEMSATSSLELLKAHAVISRSWVLAQIRNKDTEHRHAEPMVDDAEQRVVWYDHDDHTLFDVCADDHCQRYQGITRASTQAVVDAINATRGLVLMSGDELCDARFSKCCGGVFEQFETCWDNTHKDYLVARRDYADPLVFPDLSGEEAARMWIESSPAAFCNTDDARVLRQVLNNYDQETADFYRWRVEYDADALSELVLRKIGIDFGTITDLVPLHRGTSGRIDRLRIVGTKRTMVIGKELEIRRALSESHLYSSAFVVDRTDRGFVLTGAGWGHGVGLCQIGAAVMADKGYDYRQILAHYYPGSRLESI